MKAVKTIALTSAALTFLCQSVVAQDNSQSLPQAKDSYFIAAQAQLRDKLQTPVYRGRAKNVILMVGDGMSIPTVTAARILEGQQRGVDGESNNLAMDAMPFSALVKTYSHDGQVSDSAPTAAAMVSGVKMRNDVIGLTQDVVAGDCPGSKGKEVMTIFAQAEAAGMATGVISTARITHATPAATYAHVANRDWEDDKALSNEAKTAGCKDIADQLVNWPMGDGFEVAMGGGRRHFLPAEAPDPEDEGKMGNRTDKRDLTAEWTKKSNGHIWGWNGEQFKAWDIASGARFLGLFEMSHMEYEADRTKDKGAEPSLSEMVNKTIDRLSQDEDGFVLMIESGRVDHAHHAGNAARALTDAIEFDKTLKLVLEKTKREDTLVVVTADHSHTMTINGYPVRGNPILGLVKEVDGKVALGLDGKPYTTLQYANGPGALFPAVPKDAKEAPPAGLRPDLTTVDTTSVDFLQQALVPTQSETHGGDDVAVYAIGPYADLFHGTVEQNYIYHVMAYASDMAKRAAK
jgi:alkaline phosphatase